MTGAVGEPRPAAGTTDPSAAIPPADIREVDPAELDELLPDLTVTTAAATHVVELRLRTIEVSVDGSSLCLGGGQGSAAPDSCADLDSGPGALRYTDDAVTSVDAVLTSNTVAVVFVDPVGAAMPCYSEPASRVGPLVLWWCEDRVPSRIRFELAAGPRYEVTVG